MLSRPRLKHRSLAVLLYLWVAPCCPRSCIRRCDNFVQHHHAQALALCGTFVAMLVAAAAVCALNSYLLVFRRTLYESVPFETASNVLANIAALALLLGWLTGVVQAVAGGCRQIPLVGRLARRPRFMAASRVGGIAFCLTTILIASMALHASSLTRDQGGPAQSYMLYDDSGVAPRSVLSLGFYRVALATTERWGGGGVVVAPLSRKSFIDAIRYGKFVFIASHGADRGDVLLPGVFHGSDGQIYDFASLGPDEGFAKYVGPSLQLVYLSACDAGHKAAQWQEELAPARVMSFDRRSAIVEHIYWLWTWGAVEVHSLD